jgi:hypothetical protein
VLGNNDATFKPQSFAELFLPELKCCRVFKRGEAVIENYLLKIRGMLVHRDILRL